MVPGLLVTHGTYPLRIRVTYVFISVCAGYLLTSPTPPFHANAWSLLLCYLYLLIMFYRVTLGVYDLRDCESHRSDKYFTDINECVRYCMDINDLSNEHCTYEFYGVDIVDTIPKLPDVINW